MQKKHYALFIVIPCLILVLLGAFAVRAYGAKAASAKSSCSWQVVPAPTKGEGVYLDTVASLTANDIWDAGLYRTTGSSGLNKALIENWNGSQWSVIPSPNVGANGSNLNSIAAVSSNNAWAVGRYSDKNLTQHALIERWNGTTWSLVSSPEPSQYGGGLEGITAVSANDIWAVGSYYNNGSISYTLAEHWNGTKWSIVSTPDPQNNGNFLLAADAVSSNDVWAVGGSITSTGATVTLVEHWDGTQWSVVNSPSPEAGYNILTGVSALSASNIWAVGSAYNHHRTSTKTLIEHWDGGQWSIVKSPNVLHAENTLVQVTALTATNVWAVGYILPTPPGSGYQQTLIEHWDGTNWRIVNSPNPGSTNNVLNGVTHVPGSQQVWAVGESGPNYGNPLTTVYC